MIHTLAFIEWRRLLRSPLAWVLLAAVLCLLSWRWLEILDAFTTQTADHKNHGLSAQLGLDLFGFAAVLILFVTPLLTMRQFSEAFRSGSYSLLSSAPLTLTSILLGKFAGVMLFQLLLTLLPLLLSLSLAAGTQLDFGLLAAAALGLLLLSGCFSAIGLYLSALSDTPAIAAAGSYGMLLLLSILGGQGLDSGSLLHWFAWPGHYLSLQLGLVRSGDLAYFLLLTGLFLGLALHQLEKRRSIPS
jgi:ABC-2 type transport system permease protein